MSAPAIAFGPVPSRRLGQSLGINNIPPKRCSYSCVYCQVGRTVTTEAERARFYPPERIAAELASRVHELRARGESIDHLAFVPDGEPTLDLELGRAIELLRPLGVPIAVISNASLVDRADVRADLAKADWVSLKVDSVDEGIWRRIHLPAPGLSLPRILEGMRTFAASFGGTLVTDTMLIRGLNDPLPAVEATAKFVASLAPSRAFLGIPTRPTAEPTHAAPDEATFAAALRCFAAHVPVVEGLTGAGGTAYGFTGDAARDLRAITAVHPMREQEVRAFVAKAGADWELVERLVATGAIERVDYRGERFYRQRFDH
jgi:wyosine [tRNA(Phe)-imidazoG37] synthetase (radical SAM superfamily)